ncbi:MAG: rod shape-determining protein [Mycoplasmataceae bacterium]|nr:rod shape-determining protein [Mycoplasmataceae bacterium]
MATSINIKNTSKNLGNYIFSKIPYVSVDLGTTNTIVYIKGKGVVFNEPTVMIRDLRNGTIYSYGKSALIIEERLNRNYSSIRPLKSGVISDFRATYEYLEQVILDVFPSTKEKGVFVMAVPSRITKLELKAMKAIAHRLGFPYVFIEEEVKMSALGVGVDIFSNRATLVVDIGGGTTDIAIIASGNVVSSRSVKIAGRYFDEKIQKYLRDKYLVNISMHFAERLKVNQLDLTLSQTDERAKELIYVYGEDVITRLPKKVKVKRFEIVKAILPSIRRIGIEIHALIESAPAQLVGDIKRNGMFLAGGGSLLLGLDSYFEEKFKLEVSVGDAPLTSVIDGTMKYDDIIAERLSDYENWLALEEIYLGGY